MNNSMIVFILGQIIRLEGLLMIIPCLTSLIYQEHEIFAFLIVIISCLVIGTLMTLRKPANQTIYLKRMCSHGIQLDTAQYIWLHAICYFRGDPFIHKCTV